MISPQKHKHIHESEEHAKHVGSGPKSNAIHKKIEARRHPDIDDKKKSDSQSRFDAMIRGARHETPKHQIKAKIKKPKFKLIHTSAKAMEAGLKKRLGIKD